MSLKNAIGGVALLAGTAIGAAILALPVATAHLGFFQTIGLYFICWFFMTIGALYLLEANLLLGYDTNLISMAEKTLGRFGKYATWVIYLILLYALTAAYLSGATAWVSHASTHFAFSLPSFSIAIITTLLTLIVIFMGTAVVDWVNRLFMIGLIATFAVMIFATMPHIQADLIFSQVYAFDLRPFPIIITAFGSAIVIPSITSYLHGKPKQLLSVVLIGCFIPLLVYILWELAIVGLIPLSGSHGLLEIQQHGHPVTDVALALQKLLHNHWMSSACSYFSIFAIVTSLLGVTLSLFDFLADGLHLNKTYKSKLILALITFIPPLAFVLFYPHGFVVILSLAGVFAALLLGVLPALMVLGERHLQAKSPLQVPGGRLLIFVTISFFIFVIGVECFNQWENLLHLFK